MAISLMKSALLDEVIYVKRAFTRVLFKLNRQLYGVKPSELWPLTLIMHGAFDALGADCRARGCAHPSLTRLALKFLPTISAHLTANLVEKFPGCDEGRMRFCLNVRLALMPFGRIKTNQRRIISNLSCGYFSPQIPSENALTLCWSL
jgi:hypothetical protein